MNKQQPQKVQFVYICIYYFLLVSLFIVGCPLYNKKEHSNFFKGTLWHYNKKVEKTKMDCVCNLEV